MFAGYLAHYGLRDLQGVAYGWEEAEYARATMNNTREEQLRVKAWGLEVSVPRFIRDAKRFATGVRTGLEGGKLASELYPLAGTAC